MFISRLVKPAEKNYLPTELEITELCWLVTKIRHMIESAKIPTVIYTDHLAAVQIATQTSMTTTSLVRLNPRYRRSSGYLSRFRLEIRHKLGKLNTIPIALSRFPICAMPINAESSDNPGWNIRKVTQIEELAQPVSMVQVGKEWINKLKVAYKADEKFSGLIEVSDNNNAQRDNVAELPSKLNNNILYANEDEAYSRVCLVIPRIMEVGIFNYAHYQLGHLGYNRTHERIASKFYIFDLGKNLRTLLHHCHQCKFPLLHDVFLFEAYNLSSPLPIYFIPSPLTLY